MFNFVHSILISSKHSEILAKFERKSYLYFVRVVLRHLWRIGKHYLQFLNPSIKRNLLPTFNSFRCCVQTRGHHHNIGLDIDKFSLGWRIWPLIKELHRYLTKHIYFSYFCLKKTYKSLKFTLFLLVLFSGTCIHTWCRYFYVKAVCIWKRFYCIVFYGDFNLMLT